MRLIALLFTATLAAAPAGAQQRAASTQQNAAAAAEGQTERGQSAGPDATEQELRLPVSLDRIKEALQQTQTKPMLNIDERPTFRVQVLERQRLEELIASLDFKSGPVPAGGIYMAEQQRVMFPSVDNPLVQPYAAFNQGELLTILVENLVRGYIGGKALNAVSNAERAHAEAAAREEVHAAVEQFCNAQPNAGTGIALCSSLGR
jgi:hypothetical protein